MGATHEKGRVSSTTGLGTTTVQFWDWFQEGRGAAAFASLVGRT